MTGAMNDLATRVHDIADRHGFWEQDRNFGEMMMLAVSELSEALEEDRAGNPDVYFQHDVQCAARDGFAVTYDQDGKHILTTDMGAAGFCTCTPKPEGVVIEIADCLIRCLDTLISRDADIDEAVRIKVAYNMSRPYKHGKKY